MFCLHSCHFLILYTLYIFIFLYERERERERKELKQFLVLNIPYNDIWRSTKHYSATVTVTEVHSLIHMSIQYINQRYFVTILYVCGLVTGDQHRQHGYAMAMDMFNGVQRYNSQNSIPSHLHIYETIKPHIVTTIIVATIIIITVCTDKQARKMDKMNNCVIKQVEVVWQVHLM